MDTESRVMALLEEGNPAAEVDFADWPDVEGPGYLASIKDQRRPTNLPMEGRPQWVDRRLAVAAVALIVLGVVAVLLLREGADEIPVVTNPPPSTTLPESTTTPDSPATQLTGFWSGARLTLHLGEGEFQIIEGGLVTDRGTYELGESGGLTLMTTTQTARCQAGQSGQYQTSFSDDVLEVDPVGDECDNRRLSFVGSSFMAAEEVPIPESALDVVRPWSQGALIPGRYATTVFRMGFSFVLPPRWGSVPAPEQASSFGIDRSPAWMVFLALGDDTVEEGAASLRSQEGVTAGEADSVEIGGLEGVTFDFNVSQPVSLFRVAGGSGEATPEETIRVWLVDVDGTVVTIFFGSTKLTFDSHVEDGDAVVDSIVWGATD